MIKKTALLLFFCLLLFRAHAQDTSAYEIQRAKINALLAQRSAKFGQYDQSLNTRTGIFGLQTKRDIRNSNEILRQIALNDNEIFQQLKVLLDYKDLQVEQVRSNINSSSENMMGYKQTIKNLQDRNEKLSKQVDHYESQATLMYFLTAILLIAFAILVYRFNQKQKSLRYNEKTGF